MALAASDSGALSRGSSAAAEATTRRQRAWVRPWSTRARAEAMSKCGARPRYGSTSWDGKGSTLRSISASETPSSAAKKNRASAVIVSTSASVGTTSSVRPRSAATAAKNAFAGAVRPETLPAGSPSRRRLAAVLSSERRVSELEVYEDIGAACNLLFYRIRSARGSAAAGSDTPGAGPLLWTPRQARRYTAPSM